MPDERMRIILRERADSQKSVELPRFFIAINRCVFSKVQRHFPITSWSCIINLKMMRTVHRLQNIFFLVDLHRLKHGIILLPMSGLFIEFTFCDMWCPNKRKATLFFFSNEPIFQCAFQQCPFWHVQWKSGAYRGTNEKEFLLFPQLAVIAFFCFF